MLGGELPASVMAQARLGVLVLLAIVLRLPPDHGHGVRPVRVPDHLPHQGRGPLLFLVKHWETDQELSRTSEAAVGNSKGSRPGLSEADVAAY